ncbi:MAG: E3 binding domain-containing protein [Trueperaceae bacterium]|nr:E3 binding domain-containing protein [Trueperaceae bacterium]MCC6309738.1 E3 binding domain-containing protein [Trueperaceae bacterium]MCO5173912.1 E3 binding domain-containing protein [Trueperaceae bacterium]MCW5820335.1 E3 binding domain-containing protein [Trueperaceae bacterium]
MAKDVIMPALGMAQESGVLVKWLVAEGASVSEGDPLMEVETDKAIVEVPATASGVLSSVAHREGAEVKIGTVLAVLLAPGEEAGGPSRTPSTPRPSAGLAAAVAAPAVATSHAVALTPPPLPAPREASGPGASGGRPLGSPKAKRLARQRGIALEGVVGTGPGGAVRAVDLGLRAQAAAAGMPRTSAASALDPRTHAATAVPVPEAVHAVVPAPVTAAAVRRSTEAAALASGTAWCQTRLDAARLMEFLERANSSGAHAKLGTAWPERIVAADVLVKALVGALSRSAGPDAGASAGGVTINVYSATGEGRGVAIGATQTRSVLDVSLAREGAEPASAGDGRRRDEATPPIVVDDRSAQAFEQSSGTTLPAGVLLRLTLGPIAGPGSGPGGPDGGRREASLRLDYDSLALGDPKAAAIFSHLGRVLEDPFSLAVYG